MFLWFSYGFPMVFSLFVGWNPSFLYHAGDPRREASWRLEAKRSFVASGRSHTWPDRREIRRDLWSLRGKSQEVGEHNFHFTMVYGSIKPPTSIYIYIYVYGWIKLYIMIYLWLMVYGWYIYTYMLVGGLEHFIFSINIGIHHPNWFIFFRGVGIPPTR